MKASKVLLNAAIAGLFAASAVGAVANAQTAATDEKGTCTAGCNGKNSCKAAGLHECAGKAKKDEKVEGVTKADCDTKFKGKWVASTK